MRPKNGCVVNKPVMYRYHFFVAFLTIINFLSAQSIKTGLFDQTLDIGNPAIAGNTQYDATSQEYTITGGGVNMWFDKDEFQFAYKKLTGDFILRTSLEFVGEGVDPHRKIGWTVRPTLSGNAKQVSAVLHGDGLTSFQHRSEAGGETMTVGLPEGHAEVIQLERKGNTYTMHMAKGGSTFQLVHQMELDFPEEVYVGLFVCSHNPEVKETAIFSNVRIVKPAPQELKPYRDYIGSNLEIMDVETGKRKIIYQVENSIQAPNWIKDGKSLIYNSEGDIFRFDLSTREPTKIDMGPVRGNNNDHVLSFDGKTLGISANQPSGGGRLFIIYLYQEVIDQYRLLLKHHPIFMAGHLMVNLSFIPPGEMMFLICSKNQ